MEGASNPPETPTSSSEPESPPTRTRTLLVVTLVVVIAVLIGVGAYAVVDRGPTAPSNGTVTGTIELIGNPHHAAKLLSGEVDFGSTYGTGPYFKRIYPGPSGRFTVSVRPGIWGVSGTANFVRDGADRGTTEGPCQLTVVSGQISTITFQLDVANYALSTCF